MTVKSTEKREKETDEGTKETFILTLVHGEDEKLSIRKEDKPFDVQAGEKIDVLLRSSQTKLDVEED